MAGDWIKVEQATVDKPEVLRIAELLNWDRRKVLGALLDFWVWLDKNMIDPSVRKTSGFCPGDVRNMSKKSLDDVMHTPGFASCLEAVGWATFDEERAVMHVIHAERHNGQTAKSRALDQKRKREQRREVVQESSGYKPDKNRTREEKRRDITPIVPIRFAEFWEKYPGPRKVAKSKCAQAWSSRNLDPLADRILSHVALMAVSEQWRTDGGKYVPAPLTYLNQQRWEDGVPEARPETRRLAV